MAAVASGRRRWREALLLCSSLAGAAMLIGATAGAARLQPRAFHPRPLWAIALDGHRRTEPDARLLSQIRAGGVSAVVTDPRTWPQARHARLVALTTKLRLTLIEPQPRQQLRSACRAHSAAIDRCALFAGSPRAALSLAKEGAVDYVAVSVRSPAELQLLRPNNSRRTRVIGIVPLGARGVLDASWRTAVRAVALDPRTTLAVAPSGPAVPAAVRSFLALIAHPAKPETGSKGGGGATGGPANVYVATNGNDTSCARGDAAKPCASFNRAFQLAASGDVVEVAAGAYGYQTISPSPKTSAVTFRPAPGAQPTVAELSIAASHFHVEDIVASGSGNARGDLDVCDRECNPGVVDVVIRNFRGRSAFIRASNVTVQGGEFGNFDSCASGSPEDGFRLWGGSIVRTPQNDVVDGVTIHDITSGPGNTCQGTGHAGIHSDCLQAQGGVNITIRNSVFYNCPTSNIQAEPFSGATESDWTVENNVFGDTACCNSIVLTQDSSGGSCSSFVVRYNVATRPANDVYCTAGDLVSYGNIYTSKVSSCADHTSESYNVYVAGNSATCRGAGNKKCNPAFRNPRGAPPDFHLLPSDRCARGAGDPSRHPATDLDGRPRPQSAVDAGPYEIP
jgi:hypothetical protein